MKKRLLSILLAAVLVIGLGGISAFADVYTGLEAINPVADSYVNRSITAGSTLNIPLVRNMFKVNGVVDTANFKIAGLTLTSAAAPSLESLDTLFTWQFTRDGSGNVVLAMTAKNLSRSSNTSFSYNIIVQYYENGSFVSESAQFAFSGTVTPVGGSNNSQSSSSSSGTSPVSGNKITGVDPDSRLGYNYNGIWGRAGKNGAQINVGGESLSALEITGGDEITLEFDTNTFLWENGKPNPATSKITASLLRNGKITAVARYGKNSKSIVKEIDIYYNEPFAYVRIQFYDRFVSTAEKDFALTVALAYNGRYYDDTAAYLEGTISNRYLEVYADDEYIDLSYGDIAEAMESVRKVEVDLGEGVTITTRMTKGKFYYGVASTDLDGADYDVLERYPDIEAVYNLATIGLNAQTNTVRIDSDGGYGQMYVYNSYLEYLGTTSDSLPYSIKYYLSPQKLRIASVDDYEPEPDEYPGTYSPSANGSSIFDSQVPQGYYPSSGNINANPSTGR